MFKKLFKKAATRKQPEDFLKDVREPKKGVHLLEKEIEVGSYTIECRLVNELPKINFQDIDQKCSVHYMKGLRRLSVEPEGIIFILNTESKSLSVTLEDETDNIKLIFNNCMSIFSFTDGSIYVTIKEDENSETFTHMYEVHVI